jgi:hypothetical protein
VSDGHDRNYEAGVDREISVKSIAVTGLVLALIIVASGALMLWMSKGLRSAMKGSDPPPPVLIEAQTQQPPPEPRLQTSPEEDMALMLAEEKAALEGYAWVDEAAGVAKVPIARAMEILASGELPAAEPELPAELELAPEDEEPVE